MSELQLIEFIRIKNEIDDRSYLGIGDDAAIVPTYGVKELVYSSDMILENRHFELSRHSPELVGRKALAINLSDIAAMGAVPKFALVSLGIPTDFGVDRAKELWMGIQNIADEFGVYIVGGDTNSWSNGLVVSVTIAGQPPAEGAILRRGARIGDAVFVTGRLGGSFHTDHHLTFRPKVLEAQQILRLIRPTSMIDISDGLVRDLSHLCKASSVGASLRSEAIPLSERIPMDSNFQNRLHAALYDGEDFELLFTTSNEDASLIYKNFPQFFQIGMITQEATLVLDNLPIKDIGFEHSF